MGVLLSHVGLIGAFQVLVSRERASVPGDFLSQEGLTKQLRGFSTLLVFGRASIPGSSHGRALIPVSSYGRAWIIGSSHGRASVTRCCKRGVIGEFISMVQYCRSHGIECYGSALVPCFSCRYFLLKHTIQILKKKAHFVEIFFYYYSIFWKNISC